jgi:homoserine dehydrogenase
MRKKLKIGLFGFGCVGQGLYEVLNQSQLLDANIEKIVVKTKGKKRAIAEENFSYVADDILEDPNINCVVELIDDANAALEIVLKAFKNGKHVVSANKKLIAENLDLLIQAAKDAGVSFVYEAAVCGSIPIIRNIEEYYNNDALSGLEGICNGTTNYILTKTGEGKSYEQALSEAQELGFAESDPTLDVDGFDAKYKLQILLKHAFGITTAPKDVFNYGIRHIKTNDANYAKEKGYRIKLFSRAQRIGPNQIAGFVAPHMIPAKHQAYHVENEFNAVVVEALFSDQQLFVGKGAGSYPTASAVLSDISALTFDYQYEYKKSKVTELPIFTNNFKVKVYVGSTNRSLIRVFPFLQRDELFQSEGYNYATGWVDFSQIRKYNFNQEASLFLAILPDPIAPLNIGDKDVVSSEEFETLLEE